MSSEGVEEADLFELLDDPYARRILIETREESRSAEELAEACDASESTVYRRVDRLRDQGLLEAEQRIDLGGHHHEVYSARLERVTIELTAEGFVVDVDRGEDAADQFTDLYEELSGS